MQKSDQKYQTALKTVCTPEEQRELFAEYFEELATPKDAPNLLLF
jgi:hypothetical protein